LFSSSSTSCASLFLLNDTADIQMVAHQLVTGREAHWSTAKTTKSFRFYGEEEHN